MWITLAVYIVMDLAKIYKICKNISIYIYIYFSKERKNPCFIWVLETKGIKRKVFHFSATVIEIFLHSKYQQII